MWSVWVKGIAAACVAAQVAFAAGPPPAAGAGTLREGRGDGCGAVLIAPDLALTAAHCATTLRERIDARPGSIRFRTGAYPGHPATEREIVQVVAHPLFLDGQAPIAARLGADIALLRLASPIPETIARPFPVLAEPPGAGAQVMLAAWLGAKGYRAQERRCPVLEAERWLTTLDCPVATGESGSPILAATEEGLGLVGILSARAQQGHKSKVFDVLAAPRVSQLRALMAPKPRP